jgi:hypothetical protein
MSLDTCRKTHAQTRWRTILFIGGVPFAIITTFFLPMNGPSAREATLGKILDVIIWASVGLFGLLSQAWRPIRMFCHACGMYIPSNVKWVCGRCKHVNNRTFWYSFLNRCERCKCEPAGFKCSQCQGGLFAGGEKGMQHWAYTQGDSPILVMDAHALGLARLKRERELAEIEIELNRLFAEKARTYTLRRKAEEQAQPTEQHGRKKSVKERLDEDYRRSFDQDLALDEIVAAKLAEKSKELRDSPQALEDFKDWLEQWREKHIG